MFDELKKLKDIVVLWLILFAVFVIFFFFFGIAPVKVFNHTFPFVVQTDQSFAVMFLRMVEADLVPPTVTLIVTNPLSALNAQVQVSFLLAFFFTFPVLLYNLLSFIAPALYARERRAIGYVIVPAVLLFFGGCIFSYLY